MENVSSERTVRSKKARQVLSYLNELKELKKFEEDVNSPCCDNCCFIRKGDDGCRCVRHIGVDVNYPRISKCNLWERDSDGRNEL